LINERQAQVIEGLSDIQAAALDELGRQLRGSGSWRPPANDVSALSVDDEEDRRTAIVVSRRPHSAGWTVTVNNAIGSVSVGDLQILVEPKIPSGHFAKLTILAADSDTARVANGSLRLEADSGAVPAVWLAYLDSLAVTLRSDLHHDYVEASDDPPYIRGRLDPRGTAVNLARGRLRFPAKFEELSVDNPVNRTLRSACLKVASGASDVATRLLRFPETPQFETHRRIERRAREASYHLAQAGDLRPGDLEVETPRLAVHQHRALMIARHILSGVGRSVRVGDCEASCYLQPTPFVAESAVRNLLSVALAPDFAVTNRGKTVAGLSFNPDLVVYGVGGGNRGFVATGDVKYRLRNENWPRGVLEQAITFRQVFGAKIGFFIDFATGDTSDLDLSVDLGGIRFHRVSWPAHDSIDPDEAATRVLKSCREFLSTDSQLDSGSANSFE
jgi:hypothetical protein